VQARGSFGEGKVKPRWWGEDGHPPASPGSLSAARGDPAESGGLRRPGESWGAGEPAVGRGLAEGGKPSAVAFTRGSFDTWT